MQDAVAAPGQDEAAVPNAEAVPPQREPALPLRNDTILGVCEAVGEDFGFNPLWLRLLFAVSFYLDPLVVTGSYLALGAGVALARWLYPAPATEPQPVAELEAPAAANEAQAEVSLAA